jgi:hypothetical protein
MSLFVVASNGEQGLAYRAEPWAGSTFLLHLVGTTEGAESSREPFTADLLSPQIDEVFPIHRPGEKLEFATANSSGFLKLVQEKGIHLRTGALPPISMETPKVYYHLSWQTIGGVMFPDAIAMNIEELMFYIRNEKPFFVANGNMVTLMFGTAYKNAVVFSVENWFATAVSVRPQTPPMQHYCGFMSTHELISILKEGGANEMPCV